MRAWSIKPLLRACCLILLLGFALSSEAARYQASAPILNGDVHKARREALHLILLEAGQSGHLQLSTASTLINTELAEAVRLQSSATLSSFKVVQEMQEGDLLTLAAEIVLSDTNTTSECCASAPLQIRNLSYQWQKPASPIDPETETLLRLAMRHEVTRKLGNFLTDSTQAYQLRIQLQGHHRLFRSTLKLVATLVGADGQTIHTQEYPFNAWRLTENVAQDIGGATLLKPALSPATQQWFAEAISVATQQYHTLPVILPVSAAQQEVTIYPVQPYNPEQSPTLVFCKTWPVKARGEVDLLQLNTFIRPKNMTPQKITADLPFRSDGFILFQ